MDNAKIVLANGCQFVAALPPLLLSSMLLWLWIILLISFKDTVFTFMVLLVGEIFLMGYYNAWFQEKALRLLLRL